MSGQLCLSRDSHLGCASALLGADGARAWPVAMEFCTRARPPGADPWWACAFGTRMCPALTASQGCSAPGMAPLAQSRRHRSAARVCRPGTPRSAALVLRSGGGVAPPGSRLPRPGPGQRRPARFYPLASVAVFVFSGSLFSLRSTATKCVHVSVFAVFRCAFYHQMQPGSAKAGGLRVYRFVLGCFLRILVFVRTCVRAPSRPHAPPRLRTSCTTLSPSSANVRSLAAPCQRPLSLFSSTLRFGSSVRLLGSSTPRRLACSFWRRPLRRLSSSSSPLAAIPRNVHLYPVAFRLDLCHFAFLPS